MKSNRHNLLTALVLILLFLLSFQLMFATFRYDPHKGYLEPATKVWSDFTVNLHLIRSFSLGANLDRFMHGQQVEYPVFPGEPIKYHYLFYMLVGVLERLGLRIDWALNVPSALGFFLLSGMVYFLADRLFKKWWMAVLSVIFFVFNGSFAFIDFFKAHPLSLSTPQEIFNNQLFWGLAPWGKGTIASSMWNLNIYTNQRHLPLAFGLVLLFMFSAHYLEGKPWRKQLPYALLWGLGLGIFPYFHQPALLIMGVIVVCYWLTLPALRKYLTVIGIIGGLVILPQLFGLKHGDSPVNWYPGFILPRPLSVSSFLVYWWQNFGLHSVLIPFGFLLADRKVKKYLLPLFVVFILAYLVTFSPDPATNHKFFNYSLILGGMLSAFVVVSFVESIKSYRSLWLTMAGLASLGLLLLLLTLSGIIDYFAVINDYSIPIPDAEASPVTRWVRANVPPDGVILNSSFFASYPMAGRSIFLGWPYFSWSAGYDVPTRQFEMKTILETASIAQQCGLIRKHQITHIILEYPPQIPQELVPNYAFFALHGEPVYETTFYDVVYTVYDAALYCADQQ